MKTSNRPKKTKITSFGLLFVLIVPLVPCTVSANPETTFVLPGDAEIEMVWIEPGTFMMGSPDTEPGRGSREGPQYEVTITQGFWLGRYEITHGQWESVMGTRPWEEDDSIPEGAAYPAVYTSWEDVQALIDTLTARGLAGFRLPTEAEWEYACRAGTTTRWSFGDDESELGRYAWYGDNAWDVEEEYPEAYAHEVGTKLPNPWGLYDMHGNVWEWVQDWYDGSYYLTSSGTDPQGPSAGPYRVVRGGYYGYDARSMRSAYRGDLSPDSRYHLIGARLLRTGPAPGTSAVSPASWGQIKALFR